MGESFLSHCTLSSATNTRTHTHTFGCVRNLGGFFSLLFRNRRNRWRKCNLWMWTAARNWSNFSIIESYDALNFIVLDLFLAVNNFFFSLFRSLSLNCSFCSWQIHIHQPQTKHRISRYVVTFGICNKICFKIKYHINLRTQTNTHTNTLNFNLRSHLKLLCICIYFEWDVKHVVPK